MNVLIDLRHLDATERGNNPTPDALPFDLTGCEALVKAIKPHTDTLRERANERDNHDKA